jgi:hypothetical protein
LDTYDAGAETPSDYEDEGGGYDDDKTMRRTTRTRAKSATSPTDTTVQPALAFQASGGVSSAEDDDGEFV